MATVWNIAVQVLTGLAGVVGVVGVALLLLFLLSQMFSLLVAALRSRLLVAKVVWEFVYFRSFVRAERQGEAADEHHKRTTRMLLEETASLRVELEKQRLKG